MSIRSRIEKIKRALVERARRKSAALELANDLVQFQVEAELIDVCSSTPNLPDDRRQAILAIVEIWRRYARKMGVPISGTAERRIVSIYNNFIRSRVVKEPDRAGSLIAKLAES